MDLNTKNEVKIFSIKKLNEIYNNVKMCIFNSKYILNLSNDFLDMARLNTD
jgi:hypothetical protein